MAFYCCSPGKLHVTGCLKPIPAAASTGHQRAKRLAKEKVNGVSKECMCIATTLVCLIMSSVSGCDLQSTFWISSEYTASSVPLVKCPRGGEPRAAGRISDHALQVMGRSL